MGSPVVNISTSFRLKFNAFTTNVKENIGITSWFPFVSHCIYAPFTLDNFKTFQKHPSSRERNNNIFYIHGEDS